MNDVIGNELRVRWNDGGTLPVLGTDEVICTSTLVALITLLGRDRVRLTSSSSWLLASFRSHGQFREAHNDSQQPHPSGEIVTHDAPVIIIVTVITLSSPSRPLPLRPPRWRRGATSPNSRSGCSVYPPHLVARLCRGENPMFHHHNCRRLLLKASPRNVPPLLRTPLRAVRNRWGEGASLSPLCELPFSGAPLSPDYASSALTCSPSPDSSRSGHTSPLPLCGRYPHREDMGGPPYRSSILRSIIRCTSSRETSRSTTTIKNGLANSSFV